MPHLRRRKTDVAAVQGGDIGTQLVWRVSHAGRAAAVIGDLGTTSSPVCVRDVRFKNYPRSCLMHLAQNTSLHFMKHLRLPA